MRSAEGPAARDLAFHPALASVKSAKEFSRAFAFRVDAARIGRIGSSLIAFSNVRHIGRPFSVDCTRTCEKELPGAVFGRKVEGALRAINDRREHLQGGVRSLSGAGLSSGVY